MHEKPGITLIPLVTLAVCALVALLFWTALGYYVVIVTQ